MSAPAEEPGDLGARARLTTDPGYDELSLWMTWHEQAAVQTARAQATRTIKNERLARPEGRVNRNPYLPT